MFAVGDHLDVVVMRKTLTTGASLTGYGGIFKRRTINGTCLKLLLQTNMWRTVFLALSYFLLLLKIVMSC